MSNDIDSYGAKVVGVESGSPAAAAGLTGGVLVTKVDDQQIGSGETLLAAVHSKEPGKSVTLVFTDSSGDTKTVQVTLGNDLGRH